MYNTLKSYLAELSLELIHGCRAQAYDGTWLYTPDGIANYDALWLRDFSYMAEYAGFAVPEEDIIACIRYSIRYRREDGWMPDRVTRDGVGVYAAGAMGHPIGEANLDNTPFLVFTVYSLYQRMDMEHFGILFREWEPYLSRGLSLIPLNQKGLVFNDPAKPHSPYGFTDTVCKTGELFMESLLFWRACRMMEMLCSQYSLGNSAKYAALSGAVERSIGTLRDDGTGLYYAASGDCRQTDIWGMAYMLYIGFPVGKAEKETILTFLYKNYDRYMYKGQVRHLLRGEYWEKLLIEIEPETYQNGAYWATATGWILWCLAQKDCSLAADTLLKVTDCFKKEGSFECVNENYEKLPSMVVSATNVYGGLIRTAGDFPDFVKYLEENL